MPGPQLKKNRLLLFLIISFALTAFLTGYVLVTQEVQTISSSQAGTILDRFTTSNQKPYQALETYELNRSKQTDSLKKNFLNIPSGINSFAFSPDNTQVAYFVPDESGGTIFISKTDGSEVRVLFKTRIKTATLSWVGKDQVSVEISSLKEPLVIKTTP